jgi:predicted RecA/RadA family phage recombinase
MAMFEARYVQNGDAVDFIPEAEVRAGTIVVVGDLVGVTKLDVKPGGLGALATGGVFEVVKGDGVALAFAYGQAVYWNATTKKVAEATGPGLVLLGKAVNPGGSPADAETVRVRLG